MRKIVDENDEHIMTGGICRTSRFMAPFNSDKLQRFDVYTLELK